MDVNDLQTGDILLFSDYETGIFDYFLSMIRWATHSEYVHVGMIVKDPPFADHLKGTFVWESGYEGTPDPEDGEIKLGVQLTPIETMFENMSATRSVIFVRRLSKPEVFTSEVLSKIHSETYNKPYDLNLLDWFQALFGKDSEPQKTGRFWCSAFLGFIFTCAGIIDENTDWSIMRPCDFAVDGENLDYASQDCMLLPWEKVLKKD